MFTCTACDRNGRGGHVRIACRARPWAEPVSGNAEAAAEERAWASEWAGLGLRLSPAASQLGTLAEQVRIPEPSPGRGSGWRDLAQAAPSPAHLAGGAQGLTVGDPSLPGFLPVLPGGLRGCQEGWVLCFLPCQQTSRAWGGGQMPPGVLAASDPRPHKPLPQWIAAPWRPNRAPQGGVRCVAPHGSRQHPKVLTTAVSTPEARSLSGWSGGLGRRTPRAVAPTGPGWGGRRRFWALCQPDDPVL